MFKMEPMQKVRVICLESHREAMVKRMHHLGMIDLRKSKLGVGDAALDAAQLDLLNEQLIHAEGAQAVLEKQEAKPEGHDRLKAMVKSAGYAGTLSEVYKTNETIKELNERGLELAAAKKTATLLNGIKIDLSDLGSEHLSIRAFEMEAEAMKEVERELQAASKNSYVAFGTPQRKMVAIVVAYDRKANIEEVIKKHKLVEIDLHSKYFAGSPEHSLASINAQITQTDKEAQKEKAHLARLGELHYSTIAGVVEMLQIEIARANAAAIFKRTDSTFIVEGWVPNKELGAFKSAMQQETQGKVYIDELHTEHDELAPTLTKRPKWLRSYDYLIEFLSIPRSDELDPAWIFILTFPIFYGMMISDVGYGILSLALATYIKRITDPEGLVYNAASLWQINAVSAVFFGFISNQYFGLQLNQYFTSFVGFDWLKSIPILLVVSVLFGVAQIVIGLGFGFYNKMHHKEKKQAISKITSIILVLAGTVSIAGGLFGVFSATIWMAAAGVAVVSLIVTMALAGQEAGEVPTLIAHVLSYSRIMGFGLVSVIIAFLIDMAFTPNLANGIPLFLLYLVIFIVLHIMNMIVGIFEGMVQAVRLNFVEFFTKFYIGGGVKYRPFSVKRTHTKE